MKSRLLLPCALLLAFGCAGVLFPVRAGISNGSPIITAYGDAIIPGATFRSTNKGNIASGDVDLYTAPAGKRAIVFGAAVFNPTAGAINIFIETKIAGTYYRLFGAAQSVGINSTVNPSTVMIVLEPGDSYSINSAALGLNVFLKISEYPSSQSPFSAKLTALTNGASTLYTVPAGKSAIIFPVATFGGGVALPSGQVFVGNNSGGSLNYFINVVPNGGSVAASNQVQNATAIGNVAFTALKCDSTMTAGDFITVTSTAATATQFAFVTIAESNAN
jgi:hypothetical protein